MRLLDSIQFFTTLQVLQLDLYRNSKLSVLLLNNFYRLLLIIGEMEVNRVNVILNLVTYITLISLAVPHTRTALRCFGVSGFFGSGSKALEFIVQSVRFVRILLSFRT